MRSFALILALTFLITCAPAWCVDESEVDTVQEISVSLVTDEGRPATTYAIPSGGSGLSDVLFRASIDRSIGDFQSAVLEVNDPSREVRFRLPLPQPVPATLHWDGQFDQKTAIEPGRRYFMRILLTYSDGQVLSSPWGFFGTRLRTVYDEARKVKGDYLKLYVMPAGSMHVANVITKSFKSVTFPNIEGEIDLVWQDKHALKLKVEATTNLLFDATVSKTGFAYSDISLQYKYRLNGKPIRAPILPAEPPFGNYKYRLAPGATDIYGQSYNAEAGLRFFSTTLRGNGLQPIDAELPRRAEGVTLTYDGNKQLGQFRAYFGAEAGFSLFHGTLFTGGFSLGLVYDRFEFVSPGFEMRYQIFHGTPAQDQFIGAPASSITNHLLMSGVTLKFKL